MRKHKCRSHAQNKVGNMMDRAVEYWAIWLSVKHFNSTSEIHFLSSSRAANLLTQGVSDQRYEENHDISSYEHPFILFRMQIFLPNVVEKLVIVINMRMRVNFRGVQMQRWCGTGIARVISGDRGHVARGPGLSLQHRGWLTPHEWMRGRERGGKGDIVQLRVDGVVTQRAPLSLLSISYQDREAFWSQRSYRFYRLLAGYSCLFKCSFQVYVA